MIKKPYVSLYNQIFLLETNMEMLVPQNGHYSILRLECYLGLVDPIIILSSSMIIWTTGTRIVSILIAL